MEQEGVDYSEVFNFLHRIDKRVSYLEKDLQYIERHITTLEDKRSGDFKRLSDEMKNLHATIASLKDSFARCTHYMSMLGKDLKNSVKKEEMAGLNNAVDEIKFEEYVTKSDIARKAV